MMSKTPNEVYTHEATKIKFPDEANLKKVFCDYELEHFTEKTNAIKMLSGKTKSVVGIEMVKQILITEYMEVFKLVAAERRELIECMTDKQFDKVINSLAEDNEQFSNELTEFRKYLDNYKLSCWWSNQKK